MNGQPDDSTERHGSSLAKRQEALDDRDGGRGRHHRLPVDDGASLRNKHYIFTDNHILSAEEPYDGLGVASAAVLCSDTGVHLIPDSGTEFPQGADVQDEGD